MATLASLAPTFASAAARVTVRRAARAAAIPAQFRSGSVQAFAPLGYVENFARIMTSRDSISYRLWVKRYAPNI